MHGDECHRLQGGEHQEHRSQVSGDVRYQQASLAHLDRGGAVPGHRPYTGHVQVQTFQQEHREEQPCLAAGQPDARAVAAAGLVGGESDRPSGDVGVSAGLVGVSVVAIVLGDPPAVAEPDQQVGVDLADQAVNAPRARDLAMAGVVPDEAGLGEHDPQEDGDEHLPP
jgi:hypothetical protein